MTTEYLYWMNVATTNVAAGNSLGAVVGADTGDATAFTSAPRVYPIGSVFTDAMNGPLHVRVTEASESGRYIGVSVKAAMVAIVDEFNGAGPYPLLNARGVTDAQIAALKTVVFVDAGPIADFSSKAHINQFLAAHNMVLPS